MSKIEDHVNITKCGDPAQQYQIDTFMMGIHDAMNNPDTKMVVMEVRDKKTGEMQNMVAIIRSTAAGIRCLPIAILPRGKHLVKDYEAMTMDGTPSKPVEQVGRWNAPEADGNLQ